MGAHNAHAAVRLRPARWVVTVLVSLLLVVTAIVALRIAGAGGAAPNRAANGPNSTATGGTSSTTATPASPQPSAVTTLAADTPAPHPGRGPCTAVRVLASLENAPMVQALATSYAAEPRDISGHCVHVEVTSETSGDAEAQAATGFADASAAERPTVWLPDSAAWVELAHAATTHPVVPAAGSTIGQAGIVVAMPAALAHTIGWDTKAPTWAEVFATASDANVWTKLGHKDWGDFKLGKATPMFATAGLMALTESYMAAARTSTLTTADVHSSSVVQRVKADELSTSHYMTTPEQFLFHAHEAARTGSIATFLSAMIMDEKTVWDYNRGVTGTDASGAMTGMPGTGMAGDGMSPGSSAEMTGPAPAEKLVPIYPRDGVPVADEPATVLNAPWVDSAQRAAAADFIRFARTVEGQTVVRRNGFRDIEGHDAAAISAVGHAAVALHTVATPAAGVLAAVQRSFPAVRKRARVLFLLDVSGSMGDPTSNNLSKLAAAKKAVSDALGYFGSTDDVGLAAFSNRPGGAITPGIVTPVAPLESNRTQLLAQLNALTPVSQTPLYQTIDQFTSEMTTGYRSDRINAIILLSDGRNDTDHSETRQQMLTHLDSLHVNHPVLVFTLAFGHDADTATLQAVAEATGAHYYDATNPATVDEVLAHDLVTSL